MANPLLELSNYGQSIWYDNLNRELLATGRLQKMVDEDGVTGGTSNPTIFEKAVGGGDYYDEHLGEIVRDGVTLEEVFDALTVADVGRSADVFRPVYDRTGAKDGYASLEVSPTIANNTDATIADAKRLFTALDRPNAMIKIPGTPEGIPAVEECLAAGLNINITLLFGVDNYEQVAWTYIKALERRAEKGEPVDRIASVASFFVSRVDSAVDSQLESRIESADGDLEKRRLQALMGKAGIANAKIAYQKYQEIFSSERWKALEAKGAHVQRPLWASTSTKNPEYRDVMYVEELIGPNTVNTLPQNTLDSFRDHGIVAETLTKDVEKAHAHIAELEKEGIDFKAVTDKLQIDGVKAFSDSFEAARKTVEEKMSRVLEQVGAGASGE